MKISSYTTIRNGESMGYPYLESISSMAAFSDEVVVLDWGSTDDTSQKLKDLSLRFSNVKLSTNKVDLSDARFAPIADGQQKALARRKCGGDVLVQFDIDEVLHEDDAEAMIDCCKHVDRVNGGAVFIVPLIEFWGTDGKIRCDVPFYKPRITKNYPDITHGLPISSKAVDTNGSIYSRSSDSCDYIYTYNNCTIPINGVFLNLLSETARIQYFSKVLDKKLFLYMFSKLNTAQARRVPIIRHYSWFNMLQKIRNYKSYWGRFWSSMFDTNVGEQNMFFGKPWKDVSDGEIYDMAQRLTNETAGWIFHKPIDFNVARDYPFVTLQETKTNHPQSMTEWIERAKSGK